MKIYGLVGSSGTGKSYVAEEVSRETNSALIIDDGVLISKGQIIAGYSGKLERHAIRAVRRAVFMNREHRCQVISALSKYEGDTSILVLGTSEKMIHTICKNLGLGNEINWLHIQDFVSEQELVLASRLRMYGMHAMPITASEVQTSKRYRLLKQIQHRFQRRNLSTHSTAEGRRLIVNPVFSGGGIYVHPRAIRELVACLLAEEQLPFQLRQTKVEYEPILIVKLYGSIESSVNLRQATETLLSSVHSSLTDNLGLPLIQVHIRVESLVLDVQTAKRIDAPQRK